MMIWTHVADTFVVANAGGPPVWTEAVGGGTRRRAATVHPAEPMQAEVASRMPFGSVIAGGGLDKAWFPPRLVGSRRFDQDGQATVVIQKIVEVWIARLAERPGCDVELRGIDGIHAVV
jgi:hypothetical protein